MKIYVVYSREGWEILGIEKAFMNYKDAVEYIDADYNNVKENYERKFQGKIFMSFVDYCSQHIHEFEVQE
jgi:hypothetical protein